MAEKIKIATAGNILIPAYLALIQKGYSVRRELSSASHVTCEYWHAENSDSHFVAEYPLDLLGLISLFETREPDWMATDEQINSLMNEYYGK